MGHFIQNTWQPQNKDLEQRKNEKGETEKIIENHQTKMTETQEKINEVQSK